MIRQTFFTTSNPSSFSTSLNECLDLLESYVLKKNILGIVLFIDSKKDSDYFECSKIIRMCLAERDLLLPVNIQAQSVHSNVSIEIWYDDTAQSIEYREWKGVRYARCNSSMGVSVWGMGLSSEQEHLSLAEQIEYSFDALQGILQQEGLTISDIVRQWNYVPRILNVIELDGKRLQHYQVFNEIRQKHYAGNAFVLGYPAATGIGTRNGNFDLDFFALKSETPTQMIPVSNPKQDNAYVYQQKYLVGDTLSGQTKKTPLFERAKILKCQEGTTLFISGTASIVGQETIGKGDIHCQTEITINNMDVLISTLGKGPNNQYTYLRAYIKELEHFHVVQSICEANFPEVSISYLQADVCRDDLLVEIEGEVITFP